jgi:hypothetical protein
MKTIIEMARVAGVRDDGHRFEFSEYKYLERFAALVAASEREACAKVCDAMRVDTPMGSQPRTEALFYAAKNIRARGQA